MGPAAGAPRRAAAAGDEWDAGDQDAGEPDRRGLSGREVFSTAHGLRGSAKGELC